MGNIISYHITTAVTEESWSISQIIDITFCYYCLYEYVKNSKQNKKKQTKKLHKYTRGKGMCDMQQMCSIQHMYQ